MPEPFSPWLDAGPSLFAGATFSPDSRTVYFTKYSTFEVAAVKTIFTSKRSRSGWSKPEPAAFSGRWSDSTPFVSPDGARLYFASNRSGRLEMWRAAFSIADALRLTEGP